MTVPGPPPPRPLTRLGTVGSRATTTVDRTGRLSVDRPGGPPLDLSWAVGVGERWYHPHNAAAVRQRRRDGTPVVETAMRTGRGDVVATTYGVRARCDAVALDVENRSTEPVALGVTVTSGQARWVPDERVLRDGSGVLVAAARDAGDVRQVPGAAGTELVFPLVHGTTLRLLVPLDGSPPTAPVPTADQVTAGWIAQLDAGARAVLPDPAWQEAVSAGRSDALLAVSATPTAEALGALLDWGHLDLVREWLIDVARDQSPRGALGEATPGATGCGTTAVLELAARYVTVAGDDALAAALAETVTGAVQWLSGRGRAVSRERTRGLGAAAIVLGRAGHDDLAGRVLRLAGLGAEDPVSWCEPGEEVRSWVWLRAVRRMLGHGDGERLAVLDGLPPDWRGLAVETHDLPSAIGRVSYALRWHGEHPALLWEVRPRDGAPFSLACPDLAPGWVTTEIRGEELLAPATRMGR